MRKTYYLVEVHRSVEPSVKGPFMEEKGRDDAAKRSTFDKCLSFKGLKEVTMKKEINGIKINYELSGQGPCLVLIHGFSDNQTMWYNQVPEFSKSYQVLTYDVRGHGQTEVTKDEHSIDLFADDLKGLLESLNIPKACVLGYSMGGRIGLAFAMKYPEQTTGLIFANSGVIGPDVQPTPEQIQEMMARRQEMLNQIETGNIEAIADMMAERSLSPGFRDKDPEVFQKYKDIKMQNNPAAYKAIMEGMMVAMANPPDLGELQCPALIIAGEQDGFMALDVAYYMEKAIKESSLAIFPTGHASAIEVPNEFNRVVLDFLKKIY